MNAIKMYWSRRPVQVKFLAFIVPLTILLIVIGFGFVQWNAGRQAVDREHKQFAEIGARAADTLSNDFWNYNVTQAKAVVDSLLLIPNLRKVVTQELANGVLHSDSDLHFEVKDEKFADEDPSALAVASFPIERRNDSGIEQLGELRITYSLADLMANNRAQQMRTLFGSLPIALALIGGTLVALHFLFMKPISAVTRSSTEGLREGTNAEFTPVEWKAEDQLGMLVTAFNDLRIKQIAATKQLTKDQEILTSRSLELEKASEAARVARDEAIEANASKSKFLAVMSHELRTPMNAIIGFNRIVMRKCKDLIPEKQFGNLEKVGSSANILLALINGILDLSKIEAGRLEIHLEPFDLVPVLQSCMPMVDPLTAGKAVTVVRNFPESLPVRSSSQDMVRQIMLNLLSNAAKFTEKGQICISTTSVGDRVQISVSDTGIGLQQDMLDKVFDEFVQAEEHTTRHYGGTGLGLAIARKMARLLGGDLTVESTFGEGSTFTLEIPEFSVLEE